MGTTKLNSEAILDKSISYSKLADDVTQKIDSIPTKDYVDSKKPKQTAVSSPTASGNATAFIDTISQDANGVITVTKKNVNLSDATKSATGVVKLVEGDMNGESHVDGQAPSLNHTHGQYQEQINDLSGRLDGISANSETLVFDLTQISWKELDEEHGAIYTVNEILPCIGDMTYDSFMEKVSLGKTLILKYNIEGYLTFLISVKWLYIDGVYGYIFENYLGGYTERNIMLGFNNEQMSLNIDFVEPHTLTIGDKQYHPFKENVTVTVADLGLSSALKYCGITTTNLIDDSTTNPVVIDGNNHTAEQGCVVFYNDKEFVFNGSKWELLGAEATYKVVQTAVSSPSASGNATAFIDTISQDANGVITTTKKDISSATTSAAGVVELKTGDMNGKSHIDGQAPSLNHTHSQYISAYQTIKLACGTDTANTVATVTADPYLVAYGSGNNTKDAVQFKNDGFLSISTNANNGKIISFKALTGNTSSTLAVGNHTHSEYLTETQVDAKIEVAASSAGATSSNEKLYLIGATEQAESSQTYSHDNVYMSAGKLYVDNSEVASRQFVNSSLEAYSYVLVSFNERIGDLEENGGGLKVGIGYDTSTPFYIMGTTSTASGQTVTQAMASNKVYVEDDMLYATAFYEISDERLKDFHDDIDVDFEVLKTIPKKYFTWKDITKEGMTLGTSAQKVQEVYPELVSEGVHGLTVDYARLSVVALKAIDKLHEENEALRAEISEIKKHLGL